MKYFKPFLIVCLFSFSCKQEEKKPKGIWDEDRFVEVLTEFQMAEAIVRLGYHRYKDSMYLNDSVYNAAFRKANTTRVEFDSNYNYYLEHPERMEEVYEKVITNLSTRSAELEREKLQLNPDSLDQDSLE